MCEWGNNEEVEIAISDYKGCKTASVDACIAPIVQALNKSGISTVACCCGHGKNLGNIALADGRELFISPDFKSSRRLDKVVNAFIDQLIER